MTQEVFPPIRGVETITYPESDGEPMAETDIHIDLIIDMRNMLKNYFKSQPDVYVSGNLLLYYERGNTRKSVAPDLFVVFGVEKKERRTYRLWEEGKGPDFVLEVVSKRTYHSDLTDKKKLYASVLKVKEYFLYDPDGLYIHPSLQGYCLINGVYLPIEPVNDRLASWVLGLELGENDMELGLYNPKTKRWLLRPVEENEARIQAEARAQRAEEKAQQEFLTRLKAEEKAQQELFARRQAEAKAQQESLARQQAEAELVRLRALLERLHVTKE